MTDEEYEPYKHLSKVFIWEDSKIIEYDITREDFDVSAFERNITIPKISMMLITRYNIFETYEEAYVDMYRNTTARMIEKYKWQLEELEPATEEYEKICKENPHLLL